MRRSLRWLLPALVLAVAGVGGVLLIRLRPPVETRPPAALPPLVRVMPVELQTLDLTVHAQGTVMPRTESALVPEVSGTAVWVSPSLAAGAFFDEGEPLLRIERGDYELALERARAAEARAESELRRARRDLERRRALFERDFASDADLDLAENAARAAEAARREARAARRQAERDLARTEIRAPYDGRVRDKRVDVGQFVSRGTAVATLYAVDAAEIRLPVADAELAFLDLPLGYRGETQALDGPEVDLSARFAGAVHHWRGRVVRTEGEIDPRSRLVHVIARVDDPYTRRAGSDKPPLAVGLFVEAEIRGRRVEDVAVIPRAALRPGGRVWVVDGDGRLRMRDVDVLRAGGRDAVVRDGLARGDRVCLSVLEAAVDGMRVRAVEIAPAPAGRLS